MKKPITPAALLGRRTIPRDYLLANQIFWTAHEHGWLQDRIQRFPQRVKIPVAELECLRRFQDMQTWCCENLGVRGDDWGWFIGEPTVVKPPIIHWLFLSAAARVNFTICWR